MALMALSLILAANSNALIGHAEAAPASCDTASQGADKSESLVLKAASDVVASSAAIEAQDLWAGSKGKGSGAVQGGCCSLFCSPTGAVPQSTETLNPLSAGVVWDLYTKFLADFPQGGLKRPPRQSGNIRTRA
ncbi:MAG: hypothetical protein ACKVP5_24320 [Aestuariivirga sp.]